MTEVRELASAEAVAACVREARAARTPLRIIGGGHWLDAGRPCLAAESLRLASLRGITEYEPGDLTLTARAGTSLGEIADATSRHEQWLTLDPFGSRDGTIGATIATGSAGSLASAFGTPRDHLLGCEIVTGVGDVVRAGGRVVKNVAGFDLARLMTGAWGTLGALTEVTVRLRAKPEVDRTLAIEMESSADGPATRAWRWLRASPFTPLAAELCSANLARMLGIADGDVLLVRLGGNARLVRSAQQAVAELGDLQELDADVWDRLRVAEPPSAAVVRLGTTPASVGALWSAASDAAQRAGGYAHATLERGIVRCVVPVTESEEENGRLRGIVGELQSSGSRIVERLPASLWDGAPSVIADRLSTGIRQAFDPDSLLNPGILGATT
ncbi:MAG: linked oxidase protein [Gemmatimonadetes bacterium]|nr:linked oxidase protein [Gemmatimonadota bacterium]